MYRVDAWDCAQDLLFGLLVFLHSLRCLSIDILVGMERN